MNCDHVSLLLGFVTTIFYFWVLYFFLFVCSRSTKDEIFCCSSCLVRFKFFAQIYYIILQLLLLIYSSSLTFLYTDNTFAIFLCVGLQLNFSETDAIHRYQMNVVGLSLCCLNGTIWKNMDLCVAFATYSYLFCVPCLSSFLYVFFYVLLAKNNVYCYN